MFKKSKLNKNKHITPEIQNDEIHLKDDQNMIEKIKSEIDSKIKKPKFKGVSIKLEKEETQITSEKRESTIKKQFFSETVLQQAKDPEEMKKLLGVKREEIEFIKEERKKKAIDMQKELYTLPDELKVAPSTKNDYIETILKLSDAGLIEVPLPLETKYKSISEATNPQKRIDPKLAEELEYLNVLKKIGPSYSKGYKPDIKKKQIAKLNNMFEDAFCEANSRKRKLMRDKKQMENKIIEEL